MAIPDRVQTTITLEDAGTGTVSFTLLFGNGDTVTCAYELAALLPIVPPEGE